MALQHVRFLHTSDFQLGMIRRDLVGDAQARFTDDRIGVIRRLGEVCTEHGCAFMLVAGDVFEHPTLEWPTTVAVLDAFADVPVPVVLLPGNHDPLTPKSLMDRIARGEVGENLTVLSDATPIHIAEGVELVGAPLHSKYSDVDLVAEALGPLEPTESIRILLAHGQMEKRSDTPPSALIDRQIVTEALDRGVIDYVALGDTHSAQPLEEKGRIWFSGAPETTDYCDLSGGTPSNETNSGKALVVDITKIAAGEAKVDVDEVSTGRWIWEALEWELTSREDIDAALSRLRSYRDKQRTVIKYRAYGVLNATDMEYFHSSIRELEPAFACLRVRGDLNNLHVEPEQHELDELGLGGYAAAALSELRDAAASAQGDDAEAAKNAMHLFFRLAKNAGEQN